MKGVEDVNVKTLDTLDILDTLDYLGLNSALH